MNSSSSKFGDFRKFISIFKACFGEEQKSCQNIKNSKPYFSKLRFKNSYKIIENSKNGKWIMQMLRMTLSTWLFKNFYQILFLSISFDFSSILATFEADFTFFMLFLFFFEQYLVFLFGTGTRDWYRGPSVLSWSIWAFIHVLTHEP